MKRFCIIQLLLFLLIVGTRPGKAQAIITNDASYTSPASGAILDVKDLHKGFLPPRVSLISVTDVTTIASPATGLLVYNTNASITGGSGTGYYYFNGTQWETFSTGKHYIGEIFEGGKVFWLDGIGQHGLAAALADEADTNAIFGGFMVYTLALADGIEAGFINTLLISTAGYSMSYAAVLCSHHAETTGGNTIAEWYLPSKYELDMLYDNRTMIGGFSPSLYWSSNEASLSNAWMQNFSSGAPIMLSKIISGHVRCIRRF